MNTLAIIGGSGVYGIQGIRIVKTHEVDTPYGAPSGPIVEAELEHTESPSGNTKTRLLFLPRHGTHHQIPPHQLNFRANICALKKLGADQVVSVSAVGSMREEIRPGDVVIVDQYIDWTRHRQSTFFEDGIVAHVSVADPVCSDLAGAAAAATKAAMGESADAKVHETGTYLCMEGPQFSTRAESQMYRSWGVSVIGMTAMPEAKLAREAELPYATLAFSTDYDCWHESEEDVSVESVLAVLRKNADLAQKIIVQLPLHLPDPKKSRAVGALKYAVISHGEPSDAIKARLHWLLPNL